MRDKTVIVAVMLLLFALVCFICAPVTFAEDPWDVDGTGGHPSNNDDHQPGGKPPDTTNVSEPFDLIPDPGAGPDWFDVLWWHLMRGFAIGVSGICGADASVIASSASAGGSAAR